VTRERRLAITIDNRNVAVGAGLTILEAARHHGIYIPSLCAMEGLSSFGGCRMCVVEVDGLRGFPTACTTPVEEGMVIITDSAELRGLRQEILKLLLSEHPGSCLFCDETDECLRFQGTIRKAGMTTGCRFCPGDGRCQLQELAAKVGLSQTSYPVYFRNLPVERDDPFYDRDYNLCVLCGRCVRVCSMVRMNGTLSFKRRGRLTTIGPAFDRSHLEGGCEFCGACVSVCPTGTLAAKASKWYGKPEREVGTTCPFCSLGCHLVLQVKQGKVIDALPDYDSPVDHGCLCVKGRFALPEVVNSPLRLTEPRELTPMGYRSVTWEAAVEAAAERLSAISADDFLMVLSPQLSNEDLFVAQRFVREAVGSENMVSPLSFDLGEGFTPFLELVCGSAPFDTIDDAEVLFLLGFDSRYGYSPLGLRVKRAAARGARLVSLNDLETSLDTITEATFKIESPGWGAFLRMALLGQGGGKRDKGDWLESLSRDLAEASRKVLVAGPEVVRSPGRKEVLAALTEVSRSGEWKMIVAHPFTNLSGMLAMGALPGVRPGHAVSSKAAGAFVLAAASTMPVDLERKRRVIYVMGERCPEWLPDHEYLIYQNDHGPGSPFRPDLVLPSALFAEASGSIIGVDGRLRIIGKAVEPPGEARPDWWILGTIADAIAERTGRIRMAYEDVSKVQEEMRKRFRTSPEAKKVIAPKGSAHREIAAPKAARGRPERGRDGQNPYLLYYKAELETYRGLPLAEAVPGMKQIGDRGHLLVNRGDADRLGLGDNGTAEVGCDGRYLVCPVRTSSALGEGVLLLIGGDRAPFEGNPCRVDLRRTDEQGG
jgi:NADH dehydrogenase/NADH:ubiquinone oxidoreductase subunit G